MIPYSIELHAEIELDYADAFHWYELQKVGLGEQLLASIRAKLNTIAENQKFLVIRGT